MSLGDPHADIWRQPKVADAYQTGLVVEQRFSSPAVRVQFPARDGLVSNWLTIAGRGSQNDKDYWMPDIGEQVACLVDASFEEGAVVGTVWSDTDNVPSTPTANQRYFKFSDGSLLQYDRSSHALTANLCAGATVLVVAPVSVTVTAPVVQINGNLNVTGSVIAGYGTGDQVGVQTHSHTQGADTHGDGEAPTNPPTAGT